MPPVDAGNRFVVGREYATYTCRLTWQGSVFDPQFGVAKSTTILIDQSADFWVDQIAAIGLVSIKLNTDPTFRQFRTDSIAMAVQISDMRTGKSLCTTQTLSTNPDGSPVVIPWPQDASPLNVLRKTNYLEDNNNVVDNVPQPSGFHDTGTLPQPFCITRQGGLNITMTNFQNLSVNTGFILKILDVSLMFSGWKEYANASR